MKIVEKRSEKKVITWFLWLLAAAFIAAVFLLSIREGDRGVLSTITFKINALRTHILQNDVPGLTIDLPFEEYDRILNQREAALDSGVVLTRERDFVRADIQFDDQVIPVEMRLKQGEAVHLGIGEKWNYEMRVRNDQQLNGMKHFFLIDPMDNNGLNEAAFTKALQTEGMIAGHYQFVRLFLNGEDKGIYALQEGFGTELLDRNGKEDGVFVEYDAEPFWEALTYYNGDMELLERDPFANFSDTDFRYFEVNTSREPIPAADDQLEWQFERAVSLLRGLQNGELEVSQVFDVPKYGRFLALVDLWGAIEATSLINLRYYYNAESDRLEPIGFNGNPLASDDRLPLSTTYFDFDVQKAYVQALAEMVTPNYLGELQDELSAQLAMDQRVLSVEYDQELPWDRLAQRAEQISHSLSPQRPVIAYFGSPALVQDGIIQLDIANATNLPVEILGFDIDGATFLETNPDWVESHGEAIIIGDNEQLFLGPQDKNAISPASFVRFRLPITVIIAQDKELDFLQDLDVQVATRFAGLENTILVPVKAGYANVLPTQPSGLTD